MDILLWRNICTCWVYTFHRPHSFMIISVIQVESLITAALSIYHHCFSLESMWRMASHPEKQSCHHHDGAHYHHFNHSKRIRQISSSDQQQPKMFKPEHDAMHKQLVRPPFYLSKLVFVYLKCLSMLSCVYSANLLEYYVCTTNHTFRLYSDSPFFSSFVVSCLGCTYAYHSHFTFGPKYILFPNSTRSQSLSAVIHFGFFIMYWQKVPIPQLAIVFGVLMIWECHFSWAKCLIAEGWTEKQIQMKHGWP